MDTPLHAYAAAHDGLVTVAAAARLGFAWPALRTIIAAEDWTRFGRGVYLAPGVVATPRTRVRAEQMTRPAFVASHRTAASFHGAEVRTPALELVVEGSSRYDVRDGRVRRRTLCPGDVVTIDGLRVTSPLRTATDLLRDASRDEAVVAVDSLLYRGTVDLAAVASVLERHRGERNVRRAWRAFAALDPRAESVTESVARLAFRDAGLFPRTQAWLLDDAHRRVRVDFWFPAGVVVEVEGFAFHGTPEQHQADVLRFNALARLRGQTVLRFSAADVARRPRAMVAAVRSALTDRAERWAPTGGAALLVSTAVAGHRT